MNIEILHKILLGITLAAPIGPVSIEMMHRGLRTGFSSAFTVRFGAAMGNLLCLLISYYSVLQLNSNRLTIIILSTLSSVFLIQKAYIYITTTKSKLFNFKRSNFNKSGVLIGLYLSIANPIAFIFWSGIAANSSESFHTSLAFNLLIIIGVLLWGVFFSLLMSLGKKHITPEILLYINKISGVFMLYYGIKFLWKNLTILIF